MGLACAGMYRYMASVCSLSLWTHRVPLWTCVSGNTKQRAPVAIFRVVFVVVSLGARGLRFMQVFFLVFCWSNHVFRLPAG